MTAISALPWSPSVRDSGPPVPSFTQTNPTLWKEHLVHLQALQAISEDKGQQYSLTLHDLLLGMNGLDGYYAQMLATRRQTLHEVKESLHWAGEVFSWESHLEEVIQTLVGWIGDALYSPSKSKRARAS